MGSGVNSSAQGKYTGNGSATAQVIKDNLGFQPKVLKIRSVVGEVVLQEGMPGAWKQTDGAVPSFMAAGALELTEFGFQIASADAGLNSNAVDYYYEAY